MWRKVGCAVLIVAVLVVAGLAIWRATKEDGFSIGNKQADEDREPYFEPAERGNLEITVEATGSSEPITDIDVKSEATGRIIEFYVEEGDEVAEGDIICKLDQSNQELIVERQELATEQSRLAYQQARNSSSTTQKTTLETAVENASSSLANAEESLDKAQSSYDRIAEMHSKGFATDQELDNAEQSLNNARNGVDSARAALNQAETNLAAFEDETNQLSIEQARLSYESAQVSLAQARKQLGDSVIYSPIDGIVLEKPLDIGDSVVSINTDFGGGTTIVKVADMSSVQVRTSVDEIDIGNIEIGQHATVEVDAFPDRDFAGTVTNIFPQGEQTGQGLISFIVIVEVDNTERELLGNMTAAVSIETQTIEDEILIPLAATRAGDEPDKTIVYVLKEDEDPMDLKAETEEREVVLGPTDYYDVVIKEGLEEGEMVKVRGFESRIQFGG